MLTAAQVKKEVGMDQDLVNAIDVIADQYGITQAAANRIIDNVAKLAIDALAKLAEQELAKGEDFIVPGIAKLSYSYRAAQGRGDRWKAGDEVAGFGGVVSVKESDSPATKARIRLVAAPYGGAKQLKPGTKPADQSAFLRSKAGKAVAARKG